MSNILACSQVISGESSPDLLERIATGLEALEIRPSERALSLLAAHLLLVEKWNRAYNLTAIRDPAEMVVRHVLDSAAVLPLVHGGRLLDAGSGAGFPGMVLSILSPGMATILVESNTKKARFLDYAVRRLGLGAQVGVHWGRLEAYHPDREFDTVVVRALAPLKRVVALTSLLLLSGGRLVVLKGRREELDRELLELGPGWRIEKFPLSIPGLTAERWACVMERETGA